MSGIRTSLVGSPNIETHRGFILAEDEAIKTYLTGLTVPVRPGSDQTTEVGVWFRYPEAERNIKYPFITIDLVDVSPDYSRWTSDYIQDLDGLYQPSVSDTIGDPSENMGQTVRNYLPFRLSYQISVHCRSSLHDRYLMSKFFTDVFPPRPFWLGVDADNTWRRCELMDTIQADLMETTESGNKRIFRKIYTVSLIAEIPQDVITESWKVLRVFVPIVDRQMVDDYLFNVLTDSSGESVLDPVNTVPSEVRTNEGEFVYYVNDFANTEPSTASAASTAVNATTS